MSESYVECMVSARPRSIILFAKYVLIGLCALTFLMGFINAWLLLVAIASGVGAYFSIQYSNIEYEYLYLDKEIVVDRIFNKARRKRVATYQVDKIEVMAPFHSYHLDDYKNRKATVKDFSRGYEDKPDTRYVFFYNGQEKIIFEPNEAFVKAVKNVSPRKTFTD